MGNPFLGLDSATLARLYEKTLSAYESALPHVGYSINGRSITKQSIDQLSRQLGQIVSAQQFADGTTTDQTLVSFTRL